MTASPSPVLAALFDATADSVHRTAWRITGRNEDAEDVLQSVFLHLLRFPPEPWPDNPEGYVHRAAVNTSLDILRRRKRRPESAIDTEVLESPLGGERAAVGELDRERLASRLRVALELLTPLEAEVFALRAFSELSNTEIATLLDKTSNHVGVTLHAARQKLKTALAAHSAPAPRVLAREGGFAS